MATIFHKGRKILRSEIGNHNYAEIADLLFLEFKSRNIKREMEMLFSYYLILNI